MKQYKKRLTSSILIFAMILSGFVIPAKVSAAELSAGSLLELANIVRLKAMERNSDFTVTFTGSDDELNNLFGERNDFFYYTLAAPELDSPDTTDDSDYIVGNINFSKDYLATDDNGDLHFTLQYFESSDETKYVNTRTDEILNELGVATMSNYDKVKTIHDYVCNLITYKDDADNCSSVYSAYTTNYGLCNSYALCMYKLLVTAGVPCKWIGGSAGTGRDSAGHAWNLVELGDKWYTLDATWDDADNDNISYDYFLKGSSDFDEADTSQTHTMDAEYTQTDYINVFPISDTKFIAGESSEDNSDSSTGSGVSTIPNAAPTDAPSNPPASSVTAAPATNTQVSSSGSNTQEQASLPTDSNESNQDLIYNFKNIISKTKPSTSGKVSVKRKKTAYIYLYLKDEAASDLIANLQCKVTSGKNKIKATKTNYIYEKNGKLFLQVSIKGKKKGSSKIKVTVTLQNGQKKNYTFKVKVK